MKYDYSKYECPYSHLEKECGHELKSPKGYEGTHSVWCACGFRSPVFYLDPEQLGLKKKGETSTPTNEGAKTAEGRAKEYTKEKYGEGYYPDVEKAFIEGCKQLAEKEEEIDAWNKICMKKDNYARGLKNQLKATKSEMPSGDELKKIDASVIKIMDENLSIEDGVICNRFGTSLKIIKYIQSLPQSDGQRHGIDGIRTAFLAGRTSVLSSKYPNHHEAFKAYIQTIQSKEQEPKQDGQRYSEEDKFMLQKIRRYFLSKGALPFEKDACLFIDKLFQSLQSKKQEPKQDGQRYGEEELKTIATKSFQDSDLKTWNKRFKDAMVIQFINGYKLSLQSKEQEPKGSEECICSFSSINILCPLHGGE